MNTRTKDRGTQPWQSPLEFFVNSKIDFLFQLRTTNPSRYNQYLAALRNNIAAPVGSAPEIWPLTLEDLPKEMRGKYDDPTPGERAAHVALTLFATHQQSKSTAVHSLEGRLGQAVRALGLHQDKEDAVKRRFDALVTASSFEEAAYFSRGLIKQLRSGDYSLNYGRLAEQLRKFCYPDQRRFVQLEWGREYAFFTPQQDSHTDSTTA